MSSFVPIVGEIDGVDAPDEGRMPSVLYDAQGNAVDVSSLVAQRWQATEWTQIDAYTATGTADAFSADKIAYTYNDYAHFTHAQVEIEFAGVKLSGAGEVLTRIDFAGGDYDPTPYSKTLFDMVQQVRVPVEPVTWGYGNYESVFRAFLQSHGTEADTEYQIHSIRHRFVFKPSP